MTKNFIWYEFSMNKMEMKGKHQNIYPFFQNTINFTDVRKIIHA